MCPGGVPARCQGGCDEGEQDGESGQAFVAEITEAIRQRRGVGMSPLLVSAWKYKPQHNAAAAP